MSIDKMCIQNVKLVLWNANRNNGDNKKIESKTI